MSNKKAQELVRARLFLFAVLPLLEEVAKMDAEAKKIVKGLSGVICFKAPKGLSAQVEFLDGEVKATPGKDKKSSVVLFLPTIGMLNNMFSGKGFALPLPIKGLLKMGLINGFTKLADRLSFYMDPSDKVPKGKVKEIIATLLLNAAVFGAAEVGSSDEGVKDKVAKIPDGTVQIEIKQGPSVYVEKKGAVLYPKKGTPTNYSAYLGFKNTDVAYDMLTGNLDFMAAIPLGDIGLSGSLAMIEQLAALMETAGVYLE
jgi:hypothetical protein